MLKMLFGDPKQGLKLQPKLQIIYDSDLNRFVQLDLIDIHAVFEFPWGHLCHRSSILMLTDLFTGSLTDQ